MAASSFRFNEEDSFEMSKFESFLDRKSRQAKLKHNSNNNHRNSGSNNNNNNVISPRSDDGMSFVSRKKHDDYANVVLEMKRKQQNNNSVASVGVVNNNSAATADYDDGLWRTSATNNNQDTASNNEWSDFGSSHFSPPNKSSNASASPMKSFERTGRRLFRDNTTTTAAAIPSSQQQQQPPQPSHQRSRSTVRKTADLQRKLAQTYITQKNNNTTSNNNTNFMDDASDVGSVISSVFLHHSTDYSNSGSWGNNTNNNGGSGEDVFATSFGSGSFNNNNCDNNHNSFNDRKKKKGLDALLNNKRYESSFNNNNNNSDAASVISGTGSVAARRRAKAAFKNSPPRQDYLYKQQQQQQQQQQFQNNGIADASPKKMAAIQPPPTSSTARRSMRMRMQQQQQQNVTKNTNGGSNPNQLQNSPYNNHNNNNGPSSSSYIDPSIIDMEVNNALKELKIDHPDLLGGMDDYFIFNNNDTKSIKSGRSSENSIGHLSKEEDMMMMMNRDDSILSKDSRDGGSERENDTTIVHNNGVVGNSNVKSISSSIDKMNVNKKDISSSSSWKNSNNNRGGGGGRMLSHSPLTVGSDQKTLTTKSMTIESGNTFDSNNTQFMHQQQTQQQQQQQQQQPYGNVIQNSQRYGAVRSNNYGPTSSSSSAPTQQQQHQQPNTNNKLSVISVEQYESVERCSESSSLTDTSDWHHVNGTTTTAGNNASSSSGGGTNMFKDANKGSTFHKSKRIVRVGEVRVAPSSSSYGGLSGDARENNGVGRGGVTTTTTTTTTSTMNDIKEESVLPSIKDRISQFKSTGGSGVGGTNNNKMYNSPGGGSIKEEPSREKSSSVYSSSSSTTIPMSTTSHYRSRSGLPPQVPTTSSSSGQSPIFQVKLRKTKNTVLDDKISDNTKDVNVVNDGNDDKISTVERSSGSGNNTSSSAISSGLSSNPFLANVSLRSTGNSTLSWKERQQAKQNAVQAEQKQEEEQAVIIVEKGESTNDTLIPPQPDPPRKKLSYREQQELLKKEQQINSSVPTNEESKKDVATLIRERIAKNKQNSMASPNSDAGSSELDVGALRGNLKKTSYGNYQSTPPRSEVSCEDTPSPPITSEQKSSVHTRHEEENNGQFFVNEVTESSPPRRSRDEKQTTSPPDPRSALMASINKRTDKTDPSTVDDPRTSLMAAINSKRASPPPPDDDDDDEGADPKANLAAMLQKRIAAASGGGGGASSKSDTKNNLSTMLAKRSPPDEVSEGNATGGRPALKNDPKYEKYFKMLKVGMPMPAVQHAMTRDGLDPSIMECDPNKAAPEPKPAGVPLKEDPAYAKYFKMIKLGLPMGAVKNAMERDGLDSSIMDGNHNLPVSELTSNSSSSMKAKKQKDTHRRTRLHWDTIVGKVKSNTVWALVNKDEELDNIVIDETEFTSLFQAEIKTSSAPVEKSASSARSVVQVIDPKRANNGGIILARLRMSYDDMASAVERIDETAMTANQAQGIVEYMPTLDERQKLRDYMKAGDGDSASKFDKLCECEKFMVAMMTVKQSKRKLRALLFKLQFRGCIHDLARDVYSVEKACDELSASVRLRKLFGIVLNIGNRLNTAGPGEKRKAGAFSIRSLLKLNQAKAFDNKTTFLHYVVLVVQRNSEALLDFKEDLPTALKADKIYWDQCINELEEAETQLENVRKLALHEAKASKVIYSLPNKKKQQEDNDSDELSVASISLEEEVGMLRSTKIGMFALSAIKKVSQLRERVDIAREKFRQLIEYFGEDQNSKMQPHELFEIISTFCRDFDVAREDVIKLEKAKKRDEKKKETPLGDTSKNTKQTISSQSSPNLPRTPAKTSSTLRSSSCQPNMSNVLADLKRAISTESNESIDHQAAQSAPASASIPRASRQCPAQQTVVEPNSNRKVVQSATLSQQQKSAKQILHGKQTSVKEALPQCREMKPSMHNDTEQANKYPSQFLNNASLKMKYPQDEPMTPERMSPVISQSDSLVTQKYAVSEVVSAQASTTDTPPTKDVLPPSRLGRRERVRSKSLAQPKETLNALSTTTSTNTTSKEVLAVKQDKEAVPKASPSPAPTNISARAAARDRYARHKKMMHQKNTAS